jgi:hypothetical protein
MTPSAALLSKQTLIGAALGLTCVCATAGRAQPAGPNGLEGSLTAYSIDGVYQGKNQQVRKTGATCPAEQEITVDVRNGRFKLAWYQRQTFNVRISPDGTFFATTGVSPVQAEKHMTIIPTLQGSVGAAGVVADYGTRWCRYQLVATRTPMSEHLTSADGRSSAFRSTGRPQ